MRMFVLTFCPLPVPLCQLERLKQGAKDYMDAVLAAARAAAQPGARPGPAGNGVIDTSRLKNKIQASIAAMEEGLVERETEARVPTKRLCCAVQEAPAQPWPRLNKHLH